MYNNKKKEENNRSNAYLIGLNGGDENFVRRSLVR